MPPFLASVAISVLLIGVSVAIFGNEVSLQAAGGCALCLTGVVLYNHAKSGPPGKTLPQRV